jgi:hypothetical protein
MILRALAVFFLAPLLASVTQTATGQVPLPVPEAPRGTELRDADCEVPIRVNEDGTTTVKRISCTDERYVESIIEGFEAMRFKIRDVCGRVCRSVGTEIEYPISYRVSN